MPAALLLLLTLLVAPDDDVVPVRPWLRWADLEAATAENALEAALDDARRAVDDYADDPLLVEHARAWVSWLEAALELPPERRQALAALHAQVPQFSPVPRDGPVTVEDELAALERVLAERPTLVDVPHPERVRLALTIAQYHRGGGRPTVAAERLDTAFAAARARWDGDHPQLASLKVEQAAELHASARLDDAWRIVGEARRMLERNGWTEGRAWIFTLNQQAVLAGARGESAGDALATYRELVAATADPLSEEHGSHLSLMFNLAARLGEDGQLVAARAVLRRLMARQDETGMAFPARARSLMLMGETYRRQGRLAEAEEVLHGALEDLDATTWGEPPGLRASILAELGSLFLRRNHHAAAIAPLELALDLALDTRGPRHSLTVGIRQTLAHTLMDLDRHERCREVLMEILEARPPPSITAYALADMGRLLTVSGEEQAALTVLEQALELSANAGDGPLRSLEHTWGYALLRLGRDAEAVPHLQRSCQLIEQERHQVGDGFERSLFGFSPYPTLATALLRVGAHGAAWDAVERRSGRALLDLTHHRRGGGTDGPVAVARVSGADDVATTLAPDEALIGWHDGPFRDLWCWVLRADGSLRWFDAGRLTETLERPPREIVERQRDRLQAAVGSLAAADTATLEADARRLWDAFLAPALPALDGVRRLTVVTPDALTGLPLESLRDPLGRWAAERWSVAYAPSGSLLAALRRRPARVSRFSSAGDTGAGNTGSGDTGPTALVLADPPFAVDSRAEVLTGGHPRDPRTGPAAALTDGSVSTRAVARLPPLSATRHEARDLAARLTDPLLLIGEDASEQRLDQLARRGALADLDLLHFATHARADADVLDRCELFLSQDVPDAAEAALRGQPVVDGRLTAREILDDWRLDARLVTLSACETASGQAVSGEGAVGLSQAFVVAGARNVLASLWPVGDEATRLFMDAFYGAWLDEGASLAEALAAARTRLREHTDARGRRPFAHPGHWAAFVLMGAGG